jgi:chromate transporter
MGIDVTATHGPAGTEPGAPPGEAAPPDEAQPRGSVTEVFVVALRLGLTSFGGPIAHLGYFRSEYVERRKWLDEPTYADLVAVSQSLPGPSSSMLGMAIGTLRAGLAGGAAAWLGFTLPSAVMLVLFGYGADTIGSEDGWVHGLKIVAVAVVALAVWSMAKTLAFDRARGTVAIASAVVLLSWDSAAAQFAAIIGGGIVGWLAFRDAGRIREAAEVSEARPEVRVPLGRRTTVVCGVLFVVLLAGLPIARHNVDSHAVDVADGFYRSGAMVFGGGHVVLPLLESEVVDHHWMSEERFLAGYGAAQAVPGPLFTFGGYLGTAMEPEPNGVAGATLGLVAIFLPGYLLMMGALPLWGAARSRPGVQAALSGVNAAVVGVLLAALYDPVGTSAIREPTDFALALGAFGALALWKLPPWLVVVLAAAAGAVVGAV